jgi:hypothetical protein
VDSDAVSGKKRENLSPRISILLNINYLLFIIPSSPPSVSTWQFPEKSQITDEAENEFLNLPQILTHYTKMRSTSHLY